MSPELCSVPAVAALMLSLLIAAPTSPAVVSIANAAATTAPPKHRFANVLESPSAAASRDRRTAANHTNARHPSIHSQPPRRMLFVLPLIQVSSCASLGLLGILSLNELITMRPRIQRTTARTPANADARSRRVCIRPLSS